MGKVENIAGTIEWGATRLEEYIERLRAGEFESFSSVWIRPDGTSVELGASVSSADLNRLIAAHEVVKVKIVLELIEGEGERT